MTADERDEFWDEANWDEAKVQREMLEEIIEDLEALEVEPWPKGGFGG